MDKILYEINLMRKLNHQNITKILETFEDEQYYFIIMEYINGGNLFSYVKKRRKLSEKVAKFIFRQIILGIQHIHSQLIVHRDIKLENILIDMNNNIKICDFGIGIVLSSENQPLYSHCGTPVYIAPEIILSTKEKGYNGFPVDIWSAGIALYIMISGKLPFNLNESYNDFDNLDEDNSKGKNKKLKYEIIHKEPKYLENISDELRDLLKGLLNKDPKKRLTCEEILNHPWLDDIHSHKIHLFSKDERNLLSIAYKNSISGGRSAVRTIMAYEAKEKKKENSTFLPYITEYKKQVEDELTKLCQGVLKTTDDQLLKKAEDDEAKVFYIKMKGDYNRYIAEYAEGDLKKQVSDDALKAYDEATEIAKSLPVLNPIALGLALNFSVFYYEVINDHKKAIEIAKAAVDKADKELPNIDEDADENRDTVSIYNLLKENLDMWVSEEEGDN